MTAAQRPAVWLLTQSLSYRCGRTELGRRPHDCCWYSYSNDVVGQRAAAFPPSPRLLPGGRPTSAPVVSSHLYIFVRNYLLFARERAAGRYPTVIGGMMRSGRDDPEWRRTADALGDVAENAKHSGTAVIYVLPPPVEYVDQERIQNLAGRVGLATDEIDIRQPARLITGPLRSRGLTVVDATPTLMSAGQLDGPPSYGRVDRHLSPAGHQLIAALLEPLVSRLLTGRTAAATANVRPGELRHTTPE
jgi:hypothetical protein